MNNLKSTLLAASLIFLVGFSIFGQTANSVQNGRYHFPTTWDCTCIPMPGFQVTIAHQVEMDTHIYIPSGSLTIQSGGSLIANSNDRSLLVSGGGLHNNGNLEVTRLWLQSGSFSNSGTLAASAMQNSMTITNQGVFQNLDSFYTTGSFTNNGQLLNVDSITNAGNFVNNGKAFFYHFTNQGTLTNLGTITFTDFTNFGTVNNQDSLIGLNNHWNAGRLNNFPGAWIILGNSFINSIPMSSGAIMENEGRMISVNWYNLDTIKGQNGSFQVADTSLNSGWMKGSFDFCDLTPPSSAPYIDYHTGFFSENITWCQYTSNMEKQAREILIYPVPARDVLFLESLPFAEGAIRLVNLSGQISLSQRLTRVIDVSQIPAGTYILIIDTPGMEIQRKIVINR